MSREQKLMADPGKPSKRALPAWWLVFIKEVTELWIAGKALALVFIYSVFLGIVTFVIASNSELSLIPPKEMIYEAIKNVISVSLFIGLIISADSLSGERERNTLESLLLTSASRRQISVGKFLASVTFWPVAFVIAIPTVKLLSQGDAAFGPGIFWGAILGTILVLTYVSLGMLVSYWSNSNKTSYFVSISIYALFLVSAQLPEEAQIGVIGRLFQWINPLAAVNHFLSKILMNSINFSEHLVWLEAPVAFAILTLGMLFLYAAPGLRLEEGRGGRLWMRFSRAIGLGVLVTAVFMTGTSSALALQTWTDPDQPLQIFINNMEAKTVKASDTIFFDTVVTNTTAEASPMIFVAMNIINLEHEGEPIDPEDWSPERTQSIDSLAAGQSVTLSWRVNAILDGEVLIYMVAIPQPEGQHVISHPIASPGIHLTVTPFTKLSPMGVLPVAMGGPLLLLLIIYFVSLSRNRNVDMGSSL